MVNKVRSHRGRTVDMDEIRIKNQESVAIGNMNVNARGDHIDEFGRVMKTRDEVARERIKSTPKTSTAQASIISSFEDDDEVVEIQDDQKAIDRNSKKAAASAAKASNASSSTTQSKAKETPKSGTSQTDLD